MTPKPIPASGMPAELRTAVVDAMVLTHMGDADGLAACLAEIVQFGEPGMFSALACWAETARQLWTNEPEPENAEWGFEALAGGKAVDPDDAAPQARGIVWAMRFLVAVANRDHDQAFALYRVARKRSWTEDGPWDLLKIAAQLAGEVFDAEAPA